MATPRRGTPEPKEKTKAKPTGRRDLRASNLPRFLLESCDEELEKTAKRIGFEDALHLMYRRGGFSALVKRTAKYELPGKDGPTVLGVEAPKTLFPRGMLHSSVVAHLLVQKFSLGVPHSASAPLRAENRLASTGKLVPSARTSAHTKCNAVATNGGRLCCIVH